VIIKIGLVERQDGLYRGRTLKCFPCISDVTRSYAVSQCLIYVLSWILKKNYQNRYSRTAERTVQRENTQTLLLQFRLDAELFGFFMLNLHVKLDI